MGQLVEDAATATSKLLSTIKLLARMKGSMLPDDLLEHWETGNPQLAEVTAHSPGPDAVESAIRSRKHKQIFQGRESFSARVSQAQWIMTRVAQDCVDALIKVHCGMHSELLGISG